MAFGQWIMERLRKTVVFVTHDMGEAVKWHLYTSNPLVFWEAVARHVELVLVSIRPSRRRHAVWG
jgi:ABC-type nitrate/sulfonate/bicarbonate transport system ATPase subunit